MKKIFFSLLLSAFSSFSMQQVMLKLQQNNELNRKLVYAVMNNSEADVEALLQEGADPNTLHPLPFSGEKLSALHAAAVKNNTVIVQRLLNHGANPSLKDSEGNTSLHRAAGRGNSQTLALLLTADNNMVNEQNKSGTCESGYDFSTPLHLAMSAADLDSVKLLIEHGALLDNHKNRFGKTPRENLYFGLQLLCNHKYEPILTYLKENNL